MDKLQSKPLGINIRKKANIISKHWTDPWWRKNPETMKGRLLFHCYICLLENTIPAFHAGVGLLQLGVVVVYAKIASQPCRLFVIRRCKDQDTICSSFKFLFYILILYIFASIIGFSVTKDVASIADTKKRLDSGLRHESSRLGTFSERGSGP